MNFKLNRLGLLLKAPESFIDPQVLQQPLLRSPEQRRHFIRNAFVASSASLVCSAGKAQSQGDRRILELPEHSKGLGKPVVTDGYGKPSQYETNVQRRQSPGLTQTNQASVSFAPLQSLFGIVTPNGLHFERHHQGWWDIDPNNHRLMINGSDEQMVKRPLVFTMDELMRLPSVGVRRGHGKL